MTNLLLSSLVAYHSLVHLLPHKSAIATPFTRPTYSCLAPDDPKVLYAWRRMNAGRLPTDPTTDNGVSAPGWPARGCTRGALISRRYVGPLCSDLECASPPIYIGSRIALRRSSTHICSPAGDQTARHPALQVFLRPDSDRALFRRPRPGVVSADASRCACL